MAMALRLAALCASIATATAFNPSTMIHSAKPRSGIPGVRKLPTAPSSFLPLLSTHSNPTSRLRMSTVENMDVDAEVEKVKKGPKFDFKKQWWATPSRGA